MTSFLSPPLFLRCVRSPRPLLSSRNSPSLSPRRRPVCSSTPSRSSSAPSPVSSAVPSLPAIHLVACDLDGTLLNSDVTVSPGSVRTLTKLVNDTNTLFVPATGKSRAGAINALGPLGKHLCSVYPRGVPGVFLQGLVVFDLSGNLIHEAVCPDALSRLVVQLADDLNLSLLAYNRDSLLCAQSDEFVALLPKYREPPAEEVGDWEKVIGKRSLNKFIFMADPERIDEIRPVVERTVGDLGRLTQAQGNMLEVLPRGGSKGEGVRRLLECVGVEKENVLAIGDAENDLEMLKMVGVSYAVGNASEQVKQVAMFREIKSNNEDAVAEIVERVVLAPHIDENVK